MHTAQMNILINTIEKVANDKNMEEYEKKNITPGTYTDTDFTCKSKFSHTKTYLKFK